MNITTLLNKVYFTPRLKKIDFYANRAGELQHRVLDRLVRMAENTEWGKKYDYKSIHTYEDFRNRLPIQTYEEVKPYVERLRAGEQNLLWPSEIRWFAKSSGTTNDKSKFLPVSKEALEDIHYRGGKDAAALYFRINPDSHFFSGKGLILGGSHSPNLNSNHSLVGDLSAILIQNVNPLINFVRVPSKKIALMSEWETKIEAIANSTIPVNVTSLSGVPSWMLVLIKQILEKTGKQTLEEVWPNLEVFFHGGVAFTPYREQYKQVIHSPKMHYVETYNASEAAYQANQRKQRQLNQANEFLRQKYNISAEALQTPDNPNVNLPGNTPITTTGSGSGSDSGATSDKFAKEKEWREQAEASARIAYATGESDYIAYTKEMDRIAVEFCERQLLHTDLTETEKLKFFQQILYQVSLSLL